MLCVLAGLCSCISHMEESSEKTGEYSFSVEMCVPEHIEDVKSSFSGIDLTKISDLNVFVYHDGKLLKDCCRYFDDMSKLMLAFPYSENEFDLYMLANVGRVEAPALEDNLRGIRCDVDTYDTFRTKGFPAAAVFLSYRKGTHAHFKLKRLVGQYDIRMRAAAECAEYRVKDVRVHNAARDVYPFSDDAKAVSFVCSASAGGCSCGDVLTADDIQRLNSGATVSLFVLENLQGVLLPDNDDRRKKIPSTLELVQEGLSERCTYIEITADVRTPVSTYTDGKYRFYLGQDELTDFSIVRNTLYDVTLDFTQNMVNEEEWRIDVDKPDVVGVWFDKLTAMVIKGAEDMIFVKARDRDGNHVGFDVEVLSSNGYVNVEQFETEWLGNEVVALRFTSNVDICGLYPYGTEPSYITEYVRVSTRETYNGAPVYSRDIEVRIYDKLFPLLLKLQKINGGSYDILLSGHNPMGLGLALSASYVSGGVKASVPQMLRYQYYSKNGGVVLGAVSQAGRSFGTLPASVTPSNLSRIDFTVQGVSRESSGAPIAYPRLLSAEPVYLGEGNQAWFGPGSGMYPAKYADLPENDRVNFSFRDYGFDLGYTNSEWGGWSSDDDYKTTFSTTQTISTGFRYADPKAYRNSKVFFQFKDSLGVHVPTVKGFRHADHGFQKKNAEKYSACPFYFVNGGQTLCYAHLAWNHASVIYPDEENNGFTLKLYGPGRDLFDENRNGEAQNNIHEMKYWVARYENWVGTMKTRQVSQSYKGQFYMTINGASSWTGCDTSEFGCFL